MSDDLLLHPITISNSSTDTPVIISPTSSPVIPTPSSKNNIIKVRSSTGKRLPEKIDSDNLKGKWKQIDRDEALRKINKIKRKREKKILHNSEVLKSNVLKTD
jgi:aryl-phospho-beta-D-glucosidase BglC (GH1 family)